MTSSAPATLRERKMLETAARLTAVSRRLTAERGLGGFTIEEVCGEVEVSRRTFFNYFPSKEDAVLGVNPDDETERFAAEFLERGSHGWACVVDDLVDLVIVHFQAAGVDAAGHAQFVAAVEREPKLLLRFMGVTRERDRQAMELVAFREGVAVDDPRVEAAVYVLSTLLRSAGDRLLDPAHRSDLSTTLRESLAALRAVLATPAPRKAQQ